MYLTVHVEADMEFSGSKTWAILKDFGGHYQFNPLFRLSPISNGITDGIGAEREIELYDGSSIRQTILDYVEGESLLIGFKPTDLPIANATARFTIEPPDQPFCRVSIDITYEPRFGVIGGLVGPLYKPTLRSRYNMVLRGLKHFVATGEPVGDTLA